jgi:hypothetical protein
MKTKTILFSLLLTALISCRKEEEDDLYTPSSNCECGKISNDGITDGEYWIEVRNNCSSNKKRVYMDADLWLNAHIGEARCYSGSW